MTGQGSGERPRGLAPALAAILSGDTDAGLRLYREVLSDSAYRLTEVGFHLRALEQAGQSHVASIVRHLALARGADLNIHLAHAGASPQQVAAEYFRLFERGDVNAWMVSRYLLLLEQLGRRDELRALLDPRLVHIVKLQQADPIGREETFADALRTAVLEHEPLAEHEEAVQAIREMRNLKRVQTLEHPVFQQLVSMVHQEVTQLIANWQPIDHPVGQWLPATFDLRMWALICRERGFTARHVHTGGWYTGAYYATDVGSDDDASGALRIGRPEEVPEDAPGWPDLTIRPERGLLVLMPSYFTHWTEPLRGEGLRISLPFDVMDTRDSTALQP
jgi:hypothetical protein